jgi:hypothetical protein
MSDRHDARYDDLTTLLFGELAYTFDADLQIVQQPPSERSKLLPRFSNRNLTRASREKRGTNSALNLFDGPSERRFEVFKNAAAAMKLRYSATATTARS